MNIILIQNPSLIDTRVYGSDCGLNSIAMNPFQVMLQVPVNNSELVTIIKIVLNLKREN